jgi:hypothetical protein
LAQGHPDEEWQDAQSALSDQAVSDEEPAGLIGTICV